MMIARNSNSIFADLPVNWAKRLTEAGCDEKLVEKVFKAKAINNYEPLWQTFRRLPLNFQKKITEPWQLLVLSGESNAFDYAVKNLNMHSDTRSPAGELPLFYAALSNNPEQLDKALELTDKKNKKDLIGSYASNGCNVLHYAILSRNPEQYEKVLQLYKDEDLTPIATVHDSKRNALHIAALTGNPDMVDSVLATVDLLGINVKDQDDDLFNALNYAMKASNDNHRVQDELKKLGLRPEGNHNEFYFDVRDTKNEKLVLDAGPK